MKKDAVFEVIGEAWIHQNELMWSRIKVLLTIEGAILTFGYYLRESYIGPIICFLSLLLIWGIWILFLRDMAYRNKYYNSLISLAEEISISFTSYIELSNEEITSCKKNTFLPDYAHIKGTFLFKYLCIIFSIINQLFSITNFFALYEKNDFLINFLRIRL